MNYLATLINVKLDSQENLFVEWQKQLEIFNNTDWQPLNYFELSQFTSYFQNLLNSVISEIGLPYKNLVILYHDPNLYKIKTKAFGLIHKDSKRRSCVTIPITKIVESLAFYTKMKSVTPVKVTMYNKDHPILVNVSEPHKLISVSETIPRVLLQISYDISFDDIVSRNTKIWNIV